MVEALDEDPDEALRVILDKVKGNKVFAVICLADAIKHGDYPEGWGKYARPYRLVD